MLLQPGYGVTTRYQSNRLIWRRLYQQLWLQEAACDYFEPRKKKPSLCEGVRPMAVN